MAMNKKTCQCKINSGSEARADDARSFDGEPDDDFLDQQVADAESHALSANTHKTYRSGWQSWARWAAEHGLPVFPATPKRLQRWLAALYEEGKKPSTLNTYLAAVSHQHRDRPGSNPARHPKVRLLLSGLTRKAADEGIAPRQADPLRHTYIQQIVHTAYEPRRNQPGGRLETLEQARKRAETDIALVAVGHDALLRCRELLNLIWADIEPTGESGCATVRIRRSKTDQTGQGAVVPISDFAFDALMRIKPESANPGDPIFDMSPSTVTRRIKAAARAAGIDPANISSHSLRIGMAQDLAAAGIDLPGLMLAGRWKTARMIARYIQNLTARHTPAAQYLKTQEQVTTLSDRS